MRRSPQKKIAVLLVLVLALGLAVSVAPSAAAAAGSVVSKEDARAAAGRLIELVASQTAKDPNCAGGVASWRGANAGEAILLSDVGGNPFEYLVPVVDSSGRTISTIGVGAESGTWEWYSPRYGLDSFPLVSPSSAAGSATRSLSASGLDASVGRPDLRIGPDKKMYWHIPASAGDVKEYWVPAFEQGRAVSNVESPPWSSPTSGGPVPSQTRSVETGPRSPLPRRSTAQVPASYDIAGIPYHAQQTSFWCGPASLEMLFDYWGPDVEQGQIAGVADAESSYGVYNNELARAAQFSSMSSSCQDPSLKGYPARQVGYGMADQDWGNGSSRYAYRYSDLKTLISQDYPVLVLTGYLQANGPGHFRLVKGYNDTTGSIIFDDPWYSGPGPTGPNQVLNQSFFVDTLWTYSNRWGMIAAPWSVAVTKPSSVSAGQRFDVSAQVYYRGPVPMNDQYLATNASAQLQIPADYQIVAGTLAQPLTGISASGSSATVKWTLSSPKARSTDDIKVAAQGQVSGATSAYGAYKDVIGGDAIAVSQKATTRAWGTDSIGATAPSRLWYLAEGCTRNMETWVLVQNPDTVPANISITYMTPAGPIPGPSTTLPGSSRITFNVADAVPGEYSVSTTVESDKPVIAERSMYGGSRKWGTDSVGAAAPQKTWYLAEGCTAGGFETWVLVQNPLAQAANVRLTYMTPSGSVAGPTWTLPPKSRQTFNVADKVRGEWSVSTRVDSDQPIVAERAMYGNNRTWGTESIGSTEQALTSFLAEGCTAGGFETWVLVQNPAATKAHVKLTYMTTNGPAPGPEADLPPGTRKTFGVGDTLAGQWSVSTRVDSDVPVVAERSMYWGGRTEGHDSIGVSTASDYWYLAEGCTATGFETWVLLQNPGSVDANIAITYMTSRGPVTGPIDVVPAGTRKTYNVADTIPGEWQVSTMVVADNPVIAERAVYGDHQ